MGADLQTLVYVSRCAALGPLLAKDLDDILQASRRNNCQRGITGALLASDGWFTQVLEGSPAAVETVFEAIVLDSRHRDIQVLHLAPIAERRFDRLSMALAGTVDSAALLQRSAMIAAEPVHAGRTAIGDRMIAILEQLVAESDAGDH